MKAEAPVATAPTKEKFVALMSPSAIKAAAAARPELGALLKGQSVRCRLLGTGNATHGDKGIPALDPMKDLDEDTTVIGLGVPVNLLTQAKMGIEIPVGKLDKTRSHYTNNNCSEGDLKNFIEACNNLGRVSLRAYTANVAEITGAPVEEQFDQELDF